MSSCINSTDIIVSCAQGKSCGIGTCHVLTTLPDPSGVSDGAEILVECSDEPLDEKGHHWSVTTPFGGIYHNADHQTRYHTVGELVDAINGMATVLGCEVAIKGFEEEH